MAESKPIVQKTKAPAKAEGVSREEFNNVLDAIGALTGLVKQSLEKPATPEQIKVEKEIEKAGPVKITVNPEWEEIAKEVIGEAVDHTELSYGKGGGTLFTVVIKKELSNAPASYLELYKTDRRTCEVGATGEAGVRNWCVLIKQNLGRPRLIN